MGKDHAPLRANVKFLGDVLGQTLAEHLGNEFLTLIESIRHTSIAARQGDEQARKQLHDILKALPDDQLLPVCRAFSHFLNLTNVAELFHSVSRLNPNNRDKPDPLDQLFDRFAHLETDPDAIQTAVDQLNIELVLTAHPTETLRRTFIHKQVELNQCLDQWERQDALPLERKQCRIRIRELIAQGWHSDELRTHRPTPLPLSKTHCGTRCHNLSPI